jgi:hypothetical protein
MAIKKRPPLAEAEREKAIEAFGDAAVGESPLAPAPSATLAEATTSSRMVPEAISLRMLLRFPDEELPRRLQELAKQQDRSKHNMTLLVLRAGIEAMESNQ